MLCGKQVFEDLGGFLLTPLPSPLTPHPSPLTPHPSSFHSFVSCGEKVVEVVGGFLDRGEPAISAARFLIAMAALAWKTEEEDYRDDITAVGAAGSRR